MSIHLLSILWSSELSIWFQHRVITLQMFILFALCVSVSVAYVHLCVCVEDRKWHMTAKLVPILCSFINAEFQNPSFQSLQSRYKTADTPLQPLYWGSFQTTCVMFSLSMKSNDFAQHIVNRCNQLLKKEECVIFSDDEATLVIVIWRDIALFFFYYHYFVLREAIKLTDDWYTKCLYKCSFFVSVILN